MPPNTPKQKLQQENFVAEGLLLGAMTSVVDMAGPMIYVHEMGHKLAAEALYRDAQANIEVQPFVGSTNWNSDGGLSPLGQRLGEDASRATISMAGTAATTLTSVALFSAGCRLQQSNPLLGSAMMTHAGFTTGISVLYALSGVGQDPEHPQGHDFLSFQKYTGVPPLACAAALAGILPATYLALKAIG